jgi:hypothetical protein
VQKIKQICIFNAKNKKKVAFPNGLIREDLFQMRQFSGLDFFSALVDSFSYHSRPWPLVVQK